MYNRFIVATHSRALRNRILSNRINKNETCLSNYSIKRHTTTKTKNENDTISTKSSKTVTTGLTQLLNETQRNLIKEIKELSKRSKDLTSRNTLPLDKTKKYQHDTKKTLSFLEDDIKDSTFILVVAGEFNTGKSTFINALLGEELLRSGPLPTTDCLTIITHDTDTIAKNEVSIHKHSTSKLLRDITIIDTPGTNTATFFHHTEKTIQLLPNADIIFFVTSVERPLTASEMELLDYIQQYKKQLVLIVNKIDLLESLDDNYGKDVIADVVQYVKDRFPSGIVLPISSKNALIAKLAVQKEHLTDDIILPKYGAAGPMYNRSNFQSFETYLLQTLCNNKSIITTKLSSPLGIVDASLSNLKESIIQPTLSTLQKDKQTLYLLDNQMIYFKNDLIQSWNKDALSIITKALEGETLRMNQLIEHNISWYDFITGSLIFRNYDYFHDTIWNKNHDSTIDKIIPNVLDEYCESTITKAKTQTHAILEYLGKRPITSYENILVGSLPILSSPTNIQKQLDIVQLQFHNQLLEDCDFENVKEKHDGVLCRGIYDKLRFGCFGSTLCFGGGLGLCFYIQFSDLVLPLYYQGGMISTTTLISYLLYYTTKQSCIQHLQHYVQKHYITTVYQKNMMAICARYVDKIMKLFNDSIVPYVRYVNGEYDRMEKLEKECDDLLIQSSMLRQRVLDSTK